MIARKEFLAVVTVLAAYGFAGTATAGVINVNNPSFEAPGDSSNFGNSCGPVCRFGGPIPGWINGSLEQPGTQAGDFATFDTLSDGITIAWSNGTDPGDGISQTVGATVQTGDVYTLNVDLGLSRATAFLGSAGLLVNGVLYQATGVEPVRAGWSTYTATYTGLAADAGDSITIELLAGGVQGDFDNVRLNDSLESSAPEPAGFAFAAAGIGLLACLRLLWQRFVTVLPNR